MSLFDQLKYTDRVKSKKRRFNKTWNFLSESLSPPAKILDLGTPNELSEYLREKGYAIDNTSGEDLDYDPQVVAKEGYDAVTGFEILEHLVSPFSVLRSIKANKVFLSVPLQLWFSKAYKNNNDPWDRHFHEFEDWQFDWLLEKAGWEIVRREKWTNPSLIPGIRPLLRFFTPRYYIVEAMRKQ